MWRVWLYCESIGIPSQPVFLQMQAAGLATSDTYGGEEDLARGKKLGGHDIDAIGAHTILLRLLDTVVPDIEVYLGTFVASVRPLRRK